MPILAFAHIAIAFGCAVHAVHSGQPIYWLFILFMFPLLGSAVYTFSVLIPSMGESPAARKAGQAARKALDPGKELREAEHQLSISRTPGNLRRTAEAHLALNHPDQALDLLREATNGAYADDAGMLIARARAEFETGSFEIAEKSLEHLRDVHPRLNAPEGHLLYARTLEALGKNDEALQEYEAVSGYFPGAEARARWAKLLEALGHHDAANTQWYEILNAARIAPKHARKLQAKWISMARQRHRPD